jgi:hypothetical protein
MIEIKIDEQQLREISRKLDPQEVKNAAEDILWNLAIEGKSIAMHNLAGGLEQAKFTMTIQAAPLSAKLYSLMNPTRALSIEVGRQPGETVNFLQAARHVTGWRYLREVRSQEDRKAAKKMQHDIWVRGTKGKAYIAGAKAHMWRELPKKLDRLAKKIEKRFAE